MSTRIYGFKYDVYDYADCKELIDRIRYKMHLCFRDGYYELISKLYIHYVYGSVVKKYSGKFLAEYVLQSTLLIFTEDEYLESLCKDFIRIMGYVEPQTTDNNEALNRKVIRSLIFFTECCLLNPHKQNEKSHEAIEKLKLSVYLYMLDDKILILPDDVMIKNHKGKTYNFHNVIGSMQGVRDYHYQNSTDRPRHITEAEYEQRSIDWDNALNDRFVSNGLKLSLNDPHACIYLKTSNKRQIDTYVIKRFNKEKLFNKFSKDIITDSVSSTIIIDTNRIYSCIRKIEKKVPEYQQYFDFKTLEKAIDESFEF